MLKMFLRRIGRRRTLIQGSCGGYSQVIASSKS
jgi:hypothetical protein